MFSGSERHRHRLASRPIRFGLVWLQPTIDWVRARMTSRSLVPTCAMSLTALASRIVAGSESFLKLFGDRLGEHGATRFESIPARLSDVALPNVQALPICGRYLLRIWSISSVEFSPSNLPSACPHARIRGDCGEGSRPSGGVQIGFERNESFLGKGKSIGAFWFAKLGFDRRFGAVLARKVDVRTVKRSGH